MVGPSYSGRHSLCRQTILVSTIHPWAYNASSNWPPISSIIRQEAMLMATLSFAHDIRAMFRDKDVQEMMDIANFDLSNYADVRAHAADIYERVADGSMPCDGAWSAEQIAKFKQWLDEGMAA
jgi:hypothetical protein